MASLHISPQIEKERLGLYVHSYKYTERLQWFSSEQMIKKLEKKEEKLLIFGYFDWPCLKPSSGSLVKRIRQVSTENPIPHHKEGLGEIVFGSIELMMNIMVSRVVSEEDVKGVSGEPESTVIVNRLDGGEGEEKDGGSWGHTGEEERQSTTNGVQEKAF